MSRFLARILILMIQGYKVLISPLLPPACRYEPTCSQYFAQALERKGLWKGSWLGLKRLLRCHPWGGSGHDPVPD